jgi:hypothetical protein
MAEKHLSTIIKGIDYDSSGVAEFDLEDGIAILPPPTFANGGVIITEFEEMTKYGDCARNLRQTLDVRDVRGQCPLFGGFRMREIRPLECRLTL